MKAEILTIGDEIVTGHTVDTNSSFIARELMQLGIEPLWHTSVGDNLMLMMYALRVALERADVVITTGGLGPTEDDITKDAIVRVCGTELLFHQTILNDIESRYAQRGIVMPSLNRNQALLPKGATNLKNRLGSAVGILIDTHKSCLVALPGVPSEMKAIFIEELAPLLKARVRDSIVVRKIRTAGIVESALAEKIEDMPRAANVRLAYLPHYAGVDLRLISSAISDDLAREQVAPAVTWLKNELGELVYGEDEATLAGVVGDLLRLKSAKLAVAESCTGGLLAGRITDVAGSSDYFDRGFVTYTNEAKVELLGVSRDILLKCGAVSAETAKEMALGALDRARVDYAVSITGVAGPGGGSEDKPVGLVFIAVAVRDGAVGKTFVKRHRFGEDREVNRERSVGAALNYLRLALLGKLT